MLKATRESLSLSSWRQRFFWFESHIRSLWPQMGASLAIFPRGPRGLPSLQMANEAQICSVIRYILASTGLIFAFIIYMCHNVIWWHSTSFFYPSSWHDMLIVFLIWLYASELVPPSGFWFLRTIGYRWHSISACKFLCSRRELLTLKYRAKYHQIASCHAITMTSPERRCVSNHRQLNRLFNIIFWLIRYTKENTKTSNCWYFVAGSR